MNRRYANLQLQYGCNKSQKFENKEKKIMSNIVYHYTSPEGILSILKNKTLRFTDCQYLNDKNELLYIQEPLEKAWAKICEEYGRESEKSDMDKMSEMFLRSPYQEDEIDCKAFKSKEELNFADLVLKNTKTYRYYVLCCSKDKDASNMWNYFVKNGAYLGYNLGISVPVFSEKLSGIINNSNHQVKFIRRPVIYEFNKQFNILYKEMKKTIDNKDKELSEPDVKNSMKLSLKLGSDFWSFIQDKKLFFKKPAFKSENEYRFVLKVDNNFNKKDENNEGNRLKLDFRIGSSGIITPFVEWKFNLEGKRELFKQITLAPTIEPKLAEESFKRFLDTTVYKNVEIEPSSIKMRF